MHGESCLRLEAQCIANEPIRVTVLAGARLGRLSLAPSAAWFQAVGAGNNTPAK